MNRDDALKWKKAIDDKNQSVKSNGTFIHAVIPEDKKLVGGK